MADMVEKDAMTDDERERLAAWLGHHGVYSFALKCDIADFIDRLLLARGKSGIEARVRALNPPTDADLPTWHALHQTVLHIVCDEQSTSSARTEVDRG